VVANIAEIVRAIRILFSIPGTVVEVRVPKAGRMKTISGYFNDYNALAKAVSTLAVETSIFWTLNPPNPALLARANNRLITFAEKTTSDEDILERRWLLVDLDAKRPSGISATDEEHEAALERGRQIRDRLRSDGWPDPVYADSGNGSHLLYRIDLLNDESGRKLLEGCLKALAARHDDDRVEVDLTTFNAARICKVYGTVAKKGDSTQDRPYRLARIVEAPDELKPVPIELLRQLAAEVEAAPSTEAPAPRPEGGAAGRRFDVAAWIAEHGIEVAKGPEAYGGGRKWVLAACPWNQDHKDAAVFESADGKLGFHCFHASCTDKDWHAFRAHIEPQYKRAPESLGFINETDVGNAKRLVQRHGHRLRYCAALGQWFVYCHGRWQSDETGLVVQFAKDTVAAILVDAQGQPDAERERLKKHALKSEHEQRIKAMINLAKTEPGIPVSPHQFDREAYLLNVANGTLDLRTRELRPHRPEDLITKMAPVRYEAGARCRNFMRFLLQIFGSRRRLIRYLQRALGYSLTGSCREQVFFLCQGEGSNGKSTLLTVIGEMLGGDYATSASADTFVAKHFGDGIPNDLARLRGARFVTAVELEKRALDEAKLKWLTGQDKVVARFMRAEFFEFCPQFKIWIACNAKPTISGMGHALWRRIRVIPFDVTFKGKEVDRNLHQKLRAELPGILAWCVRGCLAWQRHGLGRPDMVITATETYRTEMDVVGQFLADASVGRESCCHRTPAGVRRRPAARRSRRRGARRKTPGRRHRRRRA
jgi:P4 family phage/plasmid primase-like protien